LALISSRTISDSRVRFLIVVRVSRASVMAFMVAVVRSGEYEN
jgi:hypothetical protein